MSDALIFDLMFYISNLISIGLGLYTILTWKQEDVYKNKAQIIIIICIILDAFFMFTIMFSGIPIPVFTSSIILFYYGRNVTTKERLIKYKLASLLKIIIIINMLFLIPSTVLTANLIFTIPRYSDLNPFLLYFFLYYFIPLYALVGSFLINPQKKKEIKLVKAAIINLLIVIFAHFLIVLMIQDLFLIRMFSYTFSSFVFVSQLTFIIIIKMEEEENQNLVFKEKRIYNS